MKPGVSPDTRRQVLELRRCLSLREVAEHTGLPLGTVKTICSRSGAFRDNPEHRALFSLPPIRESSQTLPAVPELPPQRRVTGDNEIDAVLWLRQVIGTGQAALIEKAMEGAKRIKTPLKELEERYTKHLVSTNPGNLFAALSSFNFADLEGLAKRSIDKAARRHEAYARFGDTLFAETPAESFCVGALAGVAADKFGFLEESEADRRFQARPELMPNTLSDCLHELAYWRDLYRLRSPCAEHYEQLPEAYAREGFAFRCLARIRPRSKDEAVAVFRYMANPEHQLMGRAETNDILLSLIG